ncbi:hypothetical protein Avbf_06887 [Armadillidium vulgare]|nr:hypothetical protein Avbf_06887 [Armadillidium vulgare]
MRLLQIDDAEMEVDLLLHQLWLIKTILIQYYVLNYFTLVFANAFFKNCQFQKIFKILHNGEEKLLLLEEIIVMYYVIWPTVPQKLILVKLNFQNCFNDKYVIPRGCNDIHHEVELGVVIGSKCQECI